MLESVSLRLVANVVTLLVSLAAVYVPWVLAAGPDAAPAVR